MNFFGYFTRFEQGCTYGDNLKTKASTKYTSCQGFSGLLPPQLNDELVLPQQEAKKVLLLHQQQLLAAVLLCC